jgi:hypothetical protein
MALAMATLGGFTSEASIKIICECVKAVAAMGLIAFIFWLFLGD